MKEKLRGDTKVRAVSVPAEAVNGSLSKAVEARTGREGTSDLPLIRALNGTADYAVIKIGGKLTSVVILT